MEISEIKKFASENPQATVTDFVSYLENKKTSTLKEEQKRLENLSDWLRALDGRFFMVKFNEHSRIVFQVSNQTNPFYVTTLTVVQPAYEIDFDPNDSVYKNLSIVLNSRRAINRLWFKCPYESADHQLGIQRSTNEIKELTELEFLQVVELYHKIKDTYVEYKNILDI